MGKVIKVENLSKAYQIGQIGTGTISKDIERWWLTKVRGKEDPFLKIDELNDSATKGQSDIVWSLKDLNFEIEQGDTVGIIGRNGAGKSTLLKMLNGLISPDAGSIEMNGKIGALIELGAGFNPILTGRENIYNNAAVIGFSKKEIDAKFDSIVEFAEIGDFLDMPVQNYSSGMKVRLGFAIAAQMEPDILIVDEVLAVGDLGFKIKCINRIQQLLKSTAVILVTHAMTQISNVCTRVILMNKGQVEFSGTDIGMGIEKYFLNFSSNEQRVISSKNILSTYS